VFLAHLKCLFPFCAVPSKNMELLNPFFIV
jgi:hypothetical protein